MDAVKGAAKAQVHITGAQRPEKWYRPGFQSLLQVGGVALSNRLPDDGGR